MKAKNIKLIVLSTLLWTTSCEKYIDVVPDNIATIDIAFNSRVNAERFFYTLYGYMPEHASTSNPGLIAGDEIWLNDVAGRDLPGLNIARGNQRVTTPYLNYWSGFGTFIALRDCNIFLENIDRPKDIEAHERERWIAEAKFLKAYYHFWLLRMYGPIPIMDENISVDSDIEELRKERSPVDEAVTYIVSLLDEAIADLPPLIQNPGEELGRVTQPVAAAVKAKVLMYAASPIFNGNSQYAGFTNDEGEDYINQTFDASKWEKAAVACKEAIDIAESSGHSLYTYPGSAQFELSDSTIVKMSLRGAVSEKWNPEVIWGSANPTAGSLQNSSFVRVDAGVKAEVVERVNSNWAPTFRMAELFYSSNGVPIEEDKAYNYSGRMDLRTAGADHKYYIQEGYKTAALHFDREPRFYSSLAFDGGIIYGQGRKNDKDPWVVQAKSGQVSARINSYQYSVTGYWPKKLIHEDDILANNYTQETYPWPIIRLADLYLLYAEALNESGGPGAEVYQYIDKVRERAGLEGVMTSWANYSNKPGKPTSKDGLREIIHQERLIELAFEGHRFWDLRRWLKLEAYMNSDIKGWDIDQESDLEYYRLRTIDRTVFTKKDYLWPIPEANLIVNPNLDQAPGW
ncbi:RagB/SusD family nutrient uptake outer membrane protein [Sinomicrobium weinanense]|uniref:RagB/SusD family nutrient uptake outer membrane protein n=1 Tax=Sinomicrobium weinanense TaxID=2842200 RepID=A0A926JW57_9FLAO|nr:RagB/SusD family nutrient uptake outer membrane protein [Sinomicrobium weinanense]MBC9798261.1 RagB/SusD family nutrient uptake outer membrane protein [Sinomicrobium weinanense]MBU3122634.1 RagB/SusD family nutrient uptake outer membrane protein [Sinomicrobium weinanense]